LVGDAVEDIESLLARGDETGVAQYLKVLATVMLAASASDSTVRSPWARRSINSIRFGLPNAVATRAN
jgi:hypothetical protein